jgi:putative colanic acid biosynthesis acetyltransferase WcaF
MRRYRLWLLRCFGAQVSMDACVYPSARIWAPWNLRMEAYASLAPHVNCYNVAKVTIGQYAIASQGAYLCTATHDYDDPAFPLYALPICLERHAWACAESFVGPGVTLHEGAVLGARAVALRDLESWSVSIGNPAFRVKSRQPH